MPSAFSQSIEAGLRTEQETLQKEFDLLKAKMDVEIEIGRAIGVAKSNEIIAESPADNYLRYCWIQWLHDDNSEVIYVPTEATLPILEAQSGRINREYVIIMLPPVV